MTYSGGSSGGGGSSGSGGGGCGSCGPGGDGSYRNESPYKGGKDFEAEARALAASVAAQIRAEMERQRQAPSEVFPPPIDIPGPFGPPPINFGGSFAVGGAVILAPAPGVPAPGLGVLARGPRGRRGDKKETPKTHPDKFRPVKGRAGKQHIETGEILEKDRFHGDHYEVYRNLKDYERGRRSGSVWEDGSFKGL